MKVDRKAIGAGVVVGAALSIIDVDVQVDLVELLQWLDLGNMPFPAMIEGHQAFATATEAPSTTLTFTS